MHDHTFVHLTSLMANKQTDKLSSCISFWTVCKFFHKPLLKMLKPNKRNKITGQSVELYILCSEWLCGAHKYWMIRSYLWATIPSNRSEKSTNNRNRHQKTIVHVASSESDNSPRFSPVPWFFLWHCVAVVGGTDVKILKGLGELVLPANWCLSISEPPVCSLSYSVQNLLSLHRSGLKSEA